MAAIDPLSKDQFRLFRLNVHDDVDVSFHVRPDVADLPDTLDCLPGIRIYLVQNRFDLVDETARRDTPEITDHPL